MNFRLYSVLFMTSPKRALFTMLPPGPRGSGRKLSLYHWSTPTTSLPQEHSEFIEDPQVNFASLLHSSSHRTPQCAIYCSDCRSGRNPMTDEETTMTETKDKAASLPCLHAASLPCSQAASLPCLQAAELPAVDAMESETTATMADAAKVAEVKKLLLSHSLPKARQRTNVFKDSYQPRGRLFGAFTTRGEGITQASFRALLPDPLDYF